jgi:predicted transposase/invertase (TIGR01784 family)
MNEKIMEQIQLVDPLDDKAFRILLSDDQCFKFIAESVLGITIQSDCIVSIQGEMSLSVNGKLIRMDNFKSAGNNVINMEAQNEASKFTYKRHLFYGSIAYAFTLQSGQDYESLKPATSIVFYKDKGEAELIEYANLSGSLIKNEEEKSMLILMAVNVKKWNEAKTETLKYLLQIINGQKISKEFAVPAVIEEFYNNVLRARAVVRYETLKEKGETEMAEGILKGYLTPEQEKTAEERGIEKGAQKVAINMLKKNKPLSEIVADTEFSPAVIRELASINKLTVNES